MADEAEAEMLREREKNGMYLANAEQYNRMRCTHVHVHI